jgi:hypothetical protein
VIVSGIDDTWQIDLVDMKKFGNINKGNHYILTVIDVFSKFAWAIPVHRKSGDFTTNAFKSILRKSKRKPKRIQFDKGTEFLNKSFKSFLEKQKIKYYCLESSAVKACIVERFNRTLKDKMWRYFTYIGKYVYIDVLNKFLESYNSSYHRTIKCTPKDVHKDNEKAIWKQIYCYTDNGFNDGESIKFRFKEGDKVRINKTKTVFEKGYEPNWTQEVFVVGKKIARNTPIYKLKDLLDEPMTGIFYEEQMQLVKNKEIIYKIDAVLKRHTRNGVKESFVTLRNSISGLRLTL